MSNWLRQIRAYLAARDDPYAGGDIANAQRLGAVLWGLVVIVAAALLPLSPPTEAIGESGWAIAAIIVATGAALVYGMRGERLGHWEALLAISFAAVLGLAILQWLAGGLGAPYDRVMLLPVLFTAAVHPPRTIALFMFVVGLAVAAPLAYDGWDQRIAGAAGAGFVIWCALAVMINLLMSGVRAQRLISASDRAEALQEARHDTLTGLGNRRAFDEELEREVTRARRLRQPLCVAMVDIENFKEINDRWGYAEGDRCLREIAVALRESLRGPELGFRWGGDEFSLILAGASASETGVIGERLRAAIHDACMRPDDEPVKTRFAVAELLDEMSAPELAEMAGIALTAAKSGAER